MKLTNAMRDVLHSRLMEHRFSADEAAFRTKRHAFAGDVYDDVYSARERELMASLPVGWLKEEDTFAVTFGGNFQRLHLGAHRLFPYKVGYTAIKSYAADHRLSKKFFDIDKDFDEFKVVRRKLADEARAIIHSAATLERLVEVWPEVKAFTSDFTKSTAPLPAVDVSDLTRALRLKKKAA